MPRAVDILRSSIADRCADLQISTLPRRATITLRDRQIAETGGPAPDFALVILHDGHGIVLGPCNLRLTPR